MIPFAIFLYEAPDGSPLHVFRAVGECDPQLDRTKIDGATNKDTAMRDLVLKHATFHKAVRDCVLQRVPSLAAIVEWTKAQIPKPAVT